MKVTLIIPIEKLKGEILNENYYFRMYKGKQIIQIQKDYRIDGWSHYMSIKKVTDTLGEWRLLLVL